MINNNDHNHINNQSYHYNSHKGKKLMVNWLYYYYN